MVVTMYCLGIPLMKTTLLAISIALPSLVTLSHAQQLKEVAFVLQNDQFSWFEVGDPNIKGTLSVSGLPSGFDGNSLAYDPGANRLLFVSGPADDRHSLYSVSLDDVILKANESVSAGAAISLGNLVFNDDRALFGGGFYNGSYYTLINETDILVKVDFMAPGGSIGSVTNINLPGNFAMHLGDLAFDDSGNLWISGTTSQQITETNGRLWHYSTTNGVNFSQVENFSPGEARNNGIFFGLEDGELYGYRLTSQEYGTIDQETGVSDDPLYVGDPFGTGGDLTNGIPINVIPEPSGVLLAAIGGGIGLMCRRRAAR